MKEFGLTVDFTIEVVLAELHAVRAKANRLGRPLRQLRRREAEVRATAVQWKAVIRGLRLPIGIWKVKDGHFHLAEQCFTLLICHRMTLILITNLLCTSVCVKLSLAEPRDKSEEIPH